MTKAPERQSPGFSMKIDLYLDVTCPWCMVGQCLLDKVLAEQFAHLKIDIEHHPVILMPDCPAGGIRILDLFNGGDIEDAQRAWEPVHAQASDVGLHLDLSYQPFTYPTWNAHILLRNARTRGTQHALCSALMHAYFQNAQNISAPEVLSNIASARGFDRDEVPTLIGSRAERALVEAEVARSKSGGITSVPTFIIGGRFALVGSGNEDEIAKLIQRALPLNGAAKSNKDIP